MQFAHVPQAGLGLELGRQAKLLQNLALVLLSRVPQGPDVETEGDAPMGAAPGKTEQVDDAEDDYTLESTEEVPALHGTPLSTGARMWTSSQFPQTLTLCKNLNSGEFLPEEAQLTRLGYGVRTVRIVST